MQEIQKENTIDFQPLDTDTKLAFLKHLSEVESNIKNHISKDFVLAHLNEKDKEGITEMSSNAYFAASIIEKIKHKTKEKGQWYWNKTNKTWEKHNYNEERLQEITKIQTTLFTTFMRKLYMVAILNRNTSKNHILNVLATSVSGVQHVTDEEREKDREENKLKTFIQAVSKNEPTRET